MASGAAGARLMVSKPLLIMRCSKCGRPCNAPKSRSIRHGTSNSACTRSIALRITAGTSVRVSGAVTLRDDLPFNRSARRRSVAMAVTGRHSMRSQTMAPVDGFRWQRASLRPVCLATLDDKLSEAVQARKGVMCQRGTHHRGDMQGAHAGHHNMVGRRERGKRNQRPGAIIRGPRLLVEDLR